MRNVIDATELSDDARDLLARANESSELDPQMLRRVRGALLAEVALGAAAGGLGTALVAKTSVAPLGMAGSAGAGVSLGLGVKVLAVAALVGAAAAGGYGAGRHSMQVPAPVAAPVVTAAPVPVVARPVVPRAPEIPAVEPVPATPVTPVVPPSVTTIPAAAALPPVVASPATPPTPTTPWAHDIANLRDAQAALVGGDPHEALRLAALVDPSGPFAGERTALSLVARCSDPTGGVTAATTKEAGDFVLAHAGTPLADRVRSACH